MATVEQIQAVIDTGVAYGEARKKYDAALAAWGKEHDSSIRETSDSSTVMQKYIDACRYSLDHDKPGERTVPLAKHVPGCEGLDGAKAFKFFQDNYDPVYITYHALHASALDAGYTETDFEHVAAQARKGDYQHGSLKLVHDRLVAQQAADAHPVVVHVKPNGAPAPVAKPAPVTDDQKNVYGFKETFRIVSHGGVVDVNNTSPRFAAARKEIAGKLQSWFHDTDSKGTPLVDFTDADVQKKLGIKPGEAFNIIDDKGHINAHNFDKATRYWQSQASQTPDARIGSAALDYLMYQTNTNLTSGYDNAKIAPAIFGKNGAYLCGKTVSCDLQNYKDGTDKDHDAQKIVERDAIVQARTLIKGLKADVADDSVYLKGLSAKEKAAVQGLFSGDKPKIKADGDLTPDEIKAFQTAFDLHGKDGIVGTETFNAIKQVGIRVAANQPIDPSDIHLAVATQMHQLHHTKHTGK